MSKIEVNAVEPQSGTTLTLGASGDTVVLAAGATSTGFGATYNGAVNWDSTIRSSNFTAVSGNGYFLDTSAGVVTVTLPANPSNGDIVAIKDWSSTAATNNILVGRNGQKIEGNTTDGKINVHGDAQTLVFSGTSRGWMVVASGLLEGIQEPEFVTATGGTVLTCGNFKTHVFTGPGSFVVTGAGNDLGSNSVEYLIVAGGGGASPSASGGGGAGGYRQNYPSPTTTGLPVTATTYPITVGSGGTAGVPGGPPAGATKGNSSIFSTITSAGGGTSGSGSGPTGDDGGSGAGTSSTNPAEIGIGNTPPVSPPQGNNGGIAAPFQPSPLAGTAGAGGGAGAVGGNAPSSTQSGAGGVGSYWPNPLFGPTAPSYGTPGPVADVRYFSGGGGGGSYINASGGSGGSGGGGAGGGPPTEGTPGTANTGGGGGGGRHPGNAENRGGAGGSGIVLIRYKYQ
jgi:hypothetical protein